MPKQEYDFENHWPVPIIYCCCLGGVYAQELGFLCVSWHIWESSEDNFRGLVLSSHIYVGSRDQTHATVLQEHALLPLSYSIGPSWCFLLLSIAFLSPQVDQSAVMSPPWQG